jgi:deoxyribodipyrimidine photolyase-related protein
LTRRWLFGDQLGPHFLDEQDQAVLLVESRAAFGRRPVHRRRAHLVLSALRHRAAELDGAEPAGGRWNFDQQNREPPPGGGLDVPPPAPFTEDDIDREVRRDLDAWQRSGEVRLTGRDGPREFPVTRAEAQAALRAFVRDRLPLFGPQQDAMLAADPVMAHSLLSAALNLGLLDPVECAHAAEDAYRAGQVPLASAEGFIRQLIGWRDYGWQLYWHFGDGYRRRNALGARTPLPSWFTDLDAEAVSARCLSDALAQVREHGYAHHIIRLMVLGNYALQRGWDPAELTSWFHTNFADGYDWVMVPNVVGMSQHADGGLMATKPYAGGVAYINRMSDYCGDCRYQPAVRVGPQACPFTAGYWSFLTRHEARFAANPRMARQVKGAARLKDLAQVAEQEKRRGSEPP